MRSLGSIIAVMALAAAISACGKSETARQESNAQASSDEQPSTAPASQPAPPSEADKQALLASLPAPYNAADLKNGERKFALCRSCHTITPSGPNMTGPNLYGVFGQKAAAKTGYRYSDALKNAGIVWDAQHLDQWLANPRTYLPGTKMSFVGLKDAAERRDLIAYLMIETDHKPR